MTPVMERFYLYLPRAAKNRAYTLEMGCGVCQDCECVEFLEFSLKQKNSV